MQIELPDNLQLAGPKDWRKLGDITAEAFSEDPVNNWLFGNPRAMKSIFTVLARDVYAKRGVCHFAGDTGATMWMKHGVDGDMSKWGMLNFVMGLSRHGSKGALKRAITAGEIMAKRHPKDPHLYLFTIGTRKAARGTGIGKALLAPVLAACDRDGMPAYLENSNPDNHGFYRAHGFERMQIFACGEGGPPLEAMWRKAR